jgi:hypothetical protein
VARAITISRHSADDRRGPARLSPFRSEDEEIRYWAAWKMIAKRTEELAGLEQIVPATRQERAALRLRIAATKNNLVSWETYIEDFEREPRAVIHPAPVKRKVA